MNCKVSSDWLPSYIKAKRPVLEIFKMTGYFPDNPRIYINRKMYTKIINFDEFGGIVREREFFLSRATT